MALLDLMPLVGRRLDQASGNGKAIGDQNNVAMVPSTLLRRVTDLQSRIDMDKQRAASQAMSQASVPFALHALHLPFANTLSPSVPQASAPAPDVAVPTSAGYAPFKFAAYGRRQA